MNNYIRYRLALKLERGKHSRPYGNNPYTDIFPQTESTPHFIVSHDHHYPSGSSRDVDLNEISTGFGMLNPLLHSIDSEHQFTIGHPITWYRPSMDNPFYEKLITNKYLTPYINNQTRVDFAPDSTRENRIAKLVRAVTLPVHLDKYIEHHRKNNIPLGFVHENIIHGDNPTNEEEHIGKLKEFLTKRAGQLAYAFLADSGEHNDSLYDNDFLKEAWAEDIKNRLQNSEEGKHIYPDVIKILTGKNKI